MRLIDADALQREYMQFHDGKRIVLVDVAPTIEPERKKGKWIDMSDGGRIKTLWAEKYKCDKCGMYGTRAWKYCPYCGADMRGGEG